MWPFSSQIDVRSDVGKRGHSGNVSNATNQGLVTRSRPRMCSATGARLQNGWRMLTDHRKFDILRSGAG